MISTFLLLRAVSSNSESSKLRKKILAECGFSEGCKGCDAALEQRDARPHSLDCRHRIEEIISIDDSLRERLELRDARLNRNKDCKIDKAPESEIVDADCKMHERECFQGATEIEKSVEQVEKENDETVKTNLMEKDIAITTESSSSSKDKRESERRERRRKLITN